MYFYDMIPYRVKEKLETKMYSPNETILFAEQENDYIYFLMEGTAEAYIQSPHGTFATLSLYEKGSFFGEIEPFYDGRKPVEITAVTSCIVKRLYKKDFLSWLQSDFEATKFLIKELANKLILNAELVEHILSLTVKERLLRSILLHYRRGTLQNLTKVKLTKEINTPVRSLNRAISSCEREGIISYADNVFSIVDMTKLQKSVPYL